ncbi:glutamate receptor ionotropic, delta-1-like [Branchiostoma floridae]|uniref:Glutamate receptor ionotropic, delta-1-like n=1 Tax=Branchiostoma floridae TaxID=7739 RepID=A0A9J7MNB7_BRAFL|nr:glutamate receptor ionotropic, delta-1-like [Branchiostoma floridae]
MKRGGLPVFLLLSVVLLSTVPTTFGSTAIGVILDDSAQIDDDHLARLFARVDVQDDGNVTEEGLRPVVARISGDDPSAAIWHGCRLVEEGVLALLSSTGCRSLLVINSVSATLRIPHVATPVRSCPTGVMPRGESIAVPYTFNMRPRPEMHARALRDMVNTLTWTMVTFIYDHDDGLTVMKNLLEQLVADGRPLNAVFLKIEWDTEDDLRRTTDERVRNLLEQGIKPTSFIVYGRSALARTILQKADKYSLLTRETQWIILQEESVKVPKLFATGIVTFFRLTFSRATYSPRSKVHSLYMQDAVSLLRESVPEAHASVAWAPSSPPSCGFGPNKVLNEDRKLTRILATSKTTGVSGTVQFDDAGWNNSSRWEIINVEFMDRNGTIAHKIGSWDAERGLQLKEPLFTRHAVTDRLLRVSVVVEEPFVMKRDTPAGPVFYGFCIDILDQMAKDHNFRYDIYETPDRKFGVQLDNGSWNGAIGQVLSRHADIAVSDLVISAQREEVVDFTKPYLDYGVRLILKKPVDKEQNWWGFLAPLDGTVWWSILGAVFGVSVLLYILHRYSPYGSYKQPHGEEKHHSDLKETVWFIIGSLMQQGGEPIQNFISGRILSTFWWFFVLIIIATYTANLAAFLTVSRMDIPVRSVQDLAGQVNIKYGTVRDSNLQSFFRSRSREGGMYERMWNFMVGSEPSAFVDTTVEGLERVQQGGYAFLWDTAVLEYEKNRKCDLIIVGDPFYKGGYGFAMPRGAPYRDDLSMTILRMQGSGHIEKLQTKWWTTNSTCSDEEATVVETTKVEFVGMAGVFAVLLMGCALSVIALLMEMLWHLLVTKQHGTPDRHSPAEIPPPQLPNGDLFV